MFVTVEILGYKKQKTGFGEESYAVQPRVSKGLTIRATVQVYRYWYWLIVTCTILHQTDYVEVVAPGMAAGQQRLKTFTTTAYRVSRGQLYRCIISWTPSLSLSLHYHPGYCSPPGVVPSSRIFIECNTTLVVWSLLLRPFYQRTCCAPVFNRMRAMGHSLVVAFSFTMHEFINII